MAKRLSGNATGKVSRDTHGRAAKDGQFVVQSPRSSVTAAFSTTGAFSGRMLEHVPAKGSSVTVAKMGRTARTTAAIVMTYTTLKKAGGSLVMTVPAPVRHALHLAEGTEMTVTVEGHKLVLEPVVQGAPTRRLRRPAYTLDDLLAQSDFSGPRSEEEQTWIDAEPVGREIW